MQHMDSIPVKRFDFFSLRDFASPEQNDAPVMELEPQVEEVAPPPPPPPTFSEKDLEFAKAAAREEGYQKGLEEGMLRAKKQDGEREAQLLGMMQQACERITGFRDAYESHIQAQKEELTRLALAVAQHVAGAALRARPELPVAHLVSECLPLLLAEPRVVITVHPSIITLMKDKLEEVGRQAGYDGTLILEPDEKMHPADCHIQWRGGSAQSSIEEIWNNIEAKLMQTPSGGDA